MSYTINGEAQQFADPIERNGTTYVPVANIVEVMGGMVSWNNTAKAASLQIDGKNVTVVNEDPYVDVDGQQSQLSANPITENGTFYVPIDFFPTALGVNATANGGDITIG